MKSLPCGHPKACLVDDGDGGTPRCAWCAEVAKITSDRDALLARIHQTAIVVHGTLNVPASATIGYIVCMQGGVLAMDIQPPRINVDLGTSSPRFTMTPVLE